MSLTINTSETATTTGKVEVICARLYYNFFLLYKVIRKMIFFERNIFYKSLNITILRKNNHFMFVLQSNSIYFRICIIYDISIL
jgi:hypothetical protein